MHQRFFSTQRYLHSRHDIVVPPEAAKGRREWVISRALCHYQLFSLIDIPASRQEQVLQLKIQQWNPFVEYGCYAVWQNEQVQVWIWDKQVPEQSWNEIGIKKATLLPETVLRTRPNEDTVQLIKCLEGVEGQIWQQGLLIGSRWWSAIPNQKEWLFFQRAHSLTTISPLSPPLETELLTRPWGYTQTRLGKLKFLYKGSVWLTLGATFFTIILTWQLVHIFIFKRSINEIQYKIEEINNDITPILSARNQALADKQRFDQIRSLASDWSQLELMAIVAEPLSKNQAHLINWNYQLGDLRFTIRAEKQLDPTWYIKTFQAKPYFKEVKAETDPHSKQLILRMRVESKQIN